MELKIYKPNKQRILRDILIMGALIYLVTILNAGISLKLALLDAVFVLGMGLLYMFVVGVLPVLRIEGGEIKYRSDYGISYTIPVDKVNSITKGSGLGGYRHALFVKYGLDTGEEKVLKIKSSIFKEDDMKDFVKSVQNGKDVSVNAELADYLAGRKTKYLWK